MPPVAETRPSPIAGSWYTGQPGVLRSQVLGWLNAAQLPDLPGEVIGVIAPHAGHRYSGITAGHAFAAVRGQQPELVVVAAPYHRGSPQNFLTSAHAFYATPLGRIEVDALAVAELDALIHEGGLRLTRVANDLEHALEIELPFLQVALPQPFRLLPLMVRSQADAECRLVGGALARVIRDKKVLLVASTDLSHFFSLETALVLDHEMLKRMSSLAPREIFAAEAAGAGYACGAGAVAVVQYAALALGARQVSILHHSTSADETGDRSSVVGYGAAAILRGA